MDETKGKLIVANGLPGSGKSSTMRQAAKLCGADIFCEPEESEWPDAVNRREQVGCVTAITWFRSVRVPMLIKADELRKSGRIVFVDSYYDKLVSLYLGKNGMEWLVPTTDHYFGVIKALSDLDYVHLPDADCVVSFRVARDNWQKMLGKRNRQLDADSKLGNTFETQRLFLDAANSYCRSHHVNHIVFDNAYRGVDKDAQELIERLSAEGML